MAHLDCDAFYASVEKRDRPELRDKPLIVGGGVRGVVTTCCYIARMSGVRSAMPMFRARNLCPQAVILPPHFAKYRAESRRIMAKLADVTPLVQALSLDEAWLDFSGTERLHGAIPALTLARLQGEIEREVGITVSIGLAANKFLAKIASDLDKPRGFAVIGGAEAQAFLAPRPVGILPGVGPQFVKTLVSDGYPLVGDLAAEEPKRLADRYGVHGLRLSRLAHGRDARAVNPHEGRKEPVGRNHLQRRSLNGRRTGRCALAVVREGRASRPGRGDRRPGGDIEAPRHRFSHRHPSPHAAVRDSDGAHAVRGVAGDAGAGGAREAVAADRRRRLRYRAGRFRRRRAF